VKGACGTLASLAKIAAYQPRIADAGGIDVLVRAMRLHLERLPLVLTACEALDSLARTSSLQPLVAQAGGIEVVVGAMRMHTSASMLQQRALLVLMKLCDRAGLVGRIKRAGGEMCIMEATFAANATENVKVWGRATLVKLAEEAEDVDARPEQCPVQELARGKACPSLPSLVTQPRDTAREPSIINGSTAEAAAGGGRRASATWHHQSPETSTIGRTNIAQQTMGDVSAAAGGSTLLFRQVCADVRRIIFKGL